MPRVKHQGTLALQGGGIQIDTYSMDVAVAPTICLILNAWLKPNVAWTEPPSIGILCEHMFGDSWPSLVLPEDQWEPLGSSYKIIGIARSAIRRDRPPFLPGLCKTPQLSHENQLPELGLTL